MRTLGKKSEMLFVDQTSEVVVKTLRLFGLLDEKEHAPLLALERVCSDEGVERSCDIGERRPCAGLGAESFEGVERVEDRPEGFVKRGQAVLERDKR